MRIAIDFDGTIVEHAYPQIGREIPFAIETLKLLQRDGHLLVLWTVREGALLGEAVDYCRQRGVVFYAVNSDIPEILQGEPASRKIAADLYIDDRNIGGLPDWGIIYQMIRSGKPFKAYEGILKNEYEPKKKGFLRKLLA